MRLNKNNIFSVIIIFLISVFYVVLNIFYFGSRIPISPDESQALFFSKYLSEQYTIIYKNPLNHEFQDKIFGSRQYVQINDNTMPSAFLGYIILLALLRGVYEPLLYVSGPILATICLIYTHKLANYLFNKKIAIISTIILGFFPVFIYWTVSFFNNIAEVTFLVGGIYYLFKSVRENRFASYIISSIFFSIAIWMRYTNILLIPFCVLTYLILNKSKINLKHVIFMVLTSIILLIPIFISNNILYGSPFTIGQNSKNQLVYSQSDLDFPKEKFPLIPFRSISIMLTNTKDYIVLFIPLLFMCFLLGIIVAFNKNQRFRKELIALLIFCIIWLLYYLGGIYFGYGSEPDISSSYARYMLIVYVILIIFASYFIVHVKNYYLQIIAIITAITLFSSITSNSLVALKNQIADSREWLSDFNMHTPSNAVIFVKGADKVIFPSRNTALYLMLSKNEQIKNQGVKETLVLMSQLLKKGYPIFILNEDDFYTGSKLNEYLSKLSKYNLKVESYDSDLSLYKIKSI